MLRGYLKGLYSKRGLVILFICQSCKDCPKYNSGHERLFLVVIVMPWLYVYRLRSRCRAYYLYRLHDLNRANYLHRLRSWCRTHYQSRLLRSAHAVHRGAHLLLLLRRHVLRCCERGAAAHYQCCRQESCCSFYIFFRSYFFHLDHSVRFFVYIRFVS